MEYVRQGIMRRVGGRRNEYVEQVRDGEGRERKKGKGTE